MLAGSAAARSIHLLSTPGRLLRIPTPSTPEVYLEVVPLLGPISERAAEGKIRVLKVCGAYKRRVRMRDWAIGRVGRQIWGSESAWMAGWLP
eukprot:354337-Chlamydomonas_euryale.AAC.2